MQHNAEDTVRPAKRFKTGHKSNSTAIYPTGLRPLPHNGLHANSFRARRCLFAALVTQSVGMGSSAERVSHAPRTSVQRPILSCYHGYEDIPREETIKKESYPTQYSASPAEPLDIDLSVAPADPVELALWVARLIETVGSQPADLAPEAILTTAQPRCHPRRIDIIPSEKANTDSHHTMLEKGVQVDETNDQHQEREWKRLGREKGTHGINTTDISVVGPSADIEQDFERHPKSVAGTISSKTLSEGNWSWPQHQFTEQIAKLRHHQRCRTPQLESGFPMSSSRSDSSQGGDHQVNLAKKFLLHTLRPIIRNEVEPSNEPTALLHKAGSAKINFDSRSLVLAVRILLRDSNLKAAVHMSLKHYGGFSSSDADAGCASMRSNVRAQIERSTSGSASVSSPETDASLSSVELKLRGGMIMGNTTSPKFDYSKSKKIIEAYNAADQILEDTARSSSPTYITPYGDPQDTYVTPYGPPEAGSASTTNGNELNTSTEAKTPPEITTSRESKKSHCIADLINEAPVHKNDSQDDEIDHAQVDRLLLLAGGGSLTDDDTDDEIEVLASFTKAEPDEDVQMVLNQVYGTVAGRGSNGVKQVANLRSIMGQAGVVKNCIIPKDQSLATSKLYATIARCAQGSSRPGISLIPYHHNVISPGINAHAPGPFSTPVVPSHPGGFGQNILPSYGSNMIGGPPHPFLGGFHGNFIPHVIGNQRGFLVPHHPGFYGHVMPTGELAPTTPGPVVQQRPFVPSSEPPPPLPYRVGTARGKTAEEAKKVRDYGFPPLPSSRPGLRADISRSPAKRKLDESILD